MDTCSRCKRLIEKGATLRYAGKSGATVVVRFCSGVCAINFNRMTPTPGVPSIAFDGMPRRRPDFSAIK